MARLFLAALALGWASHSALAADAAAAAKCAHRLDPQARQIYDLAAPDVGPDSVIKDVLVAKVRPLVMTGKMTRDAARAAARGAADCLALLK